MREIEMQFILGIFASREAKNWLRKFGRSEITEPHYPVGWIPLSCTADLHAAVAAGEVELVDLAARVNPNRKATFVVKVK